MISIGLVLNLHEILINKYGGVHGLRDYKALESAMNRPFMTFDQNELYPSPIDKATALIESLISNHPFIDGNKRIGYVLMRYFLLENDLDIKATQSEKFDFVLKIAQGQFSFEQIRAWLSEKTITFI
jgi:death on curing protein